MNYTEQLIASALQSGAKATGYNYQAATNYLKAYAPDRRYKLFALAGTCSWAHNEHGVVQYAGRAYRYQQSPEGYTVECDPTYRLLRRI